MYNKVNFNTSINARGQHILKAAHFAHWNKKSLHFHSADYVSIFKKLSSTPAVQCFPNQYLITDVNYLRTRRVFSNIIHSIQYNHSADPCKNIGASVEANVTSTEVLKLSKTKTKRYYKYRYEKLLMECNKTNKDQWYGRCVQWKQS